MQHFLRSTCCADVTQRYLYQTASGDKDVEERPFLSQQTSLSPSPSSWTGRVFLCLSANKVCKHGQHEQVSSATLASRVLIMFVKFYCSVQPNKSFLPNNSLAKVLLDCLKNLSLTLLNSLKTLTSEHVNVAVGCAAKFSFRLIREL